MIDYYLLIYRSEVEGSTEQMKDTKALGEDGLAVGRFEVLGLWGYEVVARPAKKIYDTR